MDQLNDVAPYLAPLLARVRLDVTAVRGKKGVAWTDDPLTPGRLKAHLHNIQARGVCPIKAGESVTACAVLDLDSHKGEIDWAAMCEQALAILDVAARHGIRLTAFRSYGGNGLHLYALWEAPQDARSVREAMRRVLADCELKDGAGGLVKRQVEVFPRQDDVAADGYGNQFILPLAGKSIALDPMGLEPIEPEEIVWSFSDPVMLVEKVVRLPRTDAELPEFATVRAALMQIPNPPTDPANDHYDWWVRLLFATHHATGGSEAGLELFHEWSRQHADYDEALTDKCWKGARSDRDSAITAETLFATARMHPSITDADFERIALEAQEIEQVIDGTPIAAAVEVIRELPQLAFTRERSGHIAVTQQNVVTALSSPGFIGDRVLAHDVFRGQVMISKSGSDTWRALTDHDYTELKCLLDNRKFKKTPSTELIRDAVGLVARSNQFDSAILWLEKSIPAWDGVERIDTFCPTYLHTPDTEYTRAVGRYVWTALAGRVLVPGIKADMMPIWVSLEQGMRKSSTVAALVCEPDHFVEISFSKPDETLARMMRGKLVCEVAELHGLKGREIESIKAFISRQKETWVPKYKEFDTSYLRRCILVGTSNPDEFLADPTGNRRFLPMHVGRIELDQIIDDRDQLWAEARERFKEHRVQWQDAERLAKVECEQFMQYDSWSEPVSTYCYAVDPLDPLSRSRAEVGFKLWDVMREALGYEISRIDRRAELRVSAILQELRIRKFTVWKDGRTQKVWRSCK